VTVLFYFCLFGNLGRFAFRKINSIDQTSKISLVLYLICTIFTYLSKLFRVINGTRAILY
jgi:surface polysaccharide O-acyltransferase-like enzyme